VLQSDSPVTATLANGLAAPYIAQYVMATILYRVNRLGPAMTMKAMKSWPHSITPLAAEPVFGRTLGLIGFGNIGRLTGRLAHGLGMQVIALAPTGTPRSSFSLPHIRSLAQEDYRVELVAREDIGSLLRRSDFLSLALPATPATTRMVDARMLAQVKPGAWIVNVGRGAVIDEDALLDALDNGNLGGATLDVTAIEPLPAEHSFFAHPRVFLTPHVSGYFQDYNVYASMLFAENLERYVDDQPLFNLFDPAKGY
jgi:phosphoglycerate dehydrogenase-like enzyme